MNSHENNGSTHGPAVGAGAVDAGQLSLAIDSYITVPAVLLVGDAPLGFDVYHRLRRDDDDGELKVFKTAGESLTPADLTALGKNEADESLYVAADRYDDYHLRAEERFGPLLSDEGLGQKRFNLAVRLAVQLVGELLDRGSVELVRRVGRLAKKLVEHVNSHPGDTGGLLDCRNGEHDTASHLVNVALLALPAGQAMQLSPDHQGLFVLSCLLHDIGKLSLPDSLLGKEGRLTEGEWMLYRQHPSRGAEWLRNLNCQPMIVELAMTHHETPDGRGFPQNLPSRGLHPWARMLGVLNAYDRLTSSRAFRYAVAPEQAIAILRAAPDQCDGESVALLDRLIKTENMDGPDALAQADEPSDADSKKRRAAICLPALSSFLPLPPASLQKAAATRCPAPSPDTERRSYPRHTLSTSCRVQYVRPGASPESHISFWVQTLDISRSGLQFLNGEPMHPGEVISVFLPSPRGRHVTAKIVRCRRGSGGLYLIAARFDY